MSYVRVLALTRMVLQASDCIPLHKAALALDYTLLHMVLAPDCALPRMFLPLVRAKELVKALPFYMALARA